VKVIFLDIDGVLNCRNRWMHLPMFDRYTSSRLDPDCIQKIVDLAIKTESKIVISSAWRVLYKWQDLLNILQKAGFKDSIELIIDQTPKGSGGGPDIRASHRGSEIDEWLSEHPEVVKFVIFDDDEDMEPYLHLLVKTTWDDGLKDEHIQKAESILMDELPSSPCV
jgi:hypothetical protein